MNRQYLVSTLFCSVLFFSVNADTPPITVSARPFPVFNWFILPTGHWYAGVQGGVTFGSATGNNALQIALPVFPATSFNATSAGTGSEYELFGGYAVEREATWFPSYRVGINLWHSSLPVNGQRTWDYDIADIHESNTYQFNVNVMAVGLNASTEIYRWHGLAPFVGIGLNFASVQTADFISNPDTNGAIFSFANKTSAKIFYNVEAGIRYNLPSQWKLQNWQAQLSYRYVPIGQISTGEYTTVSNVSSGLSNTITMSEVLLGINYLF